ncbi:class I SAM-dependent methyltransferase [Patescibacteria group bacterium]|nr:MAG: class I SAM-dependent methyltransferase [Patescibacteria group bacterium]
MSQRDTNKFYADQVVRVAPGQMEFIKKYAGKQILDVAAATGDYVEALNQEGYECTGSDLNKEYVAIAKKRNLPVIVADASNLKLKDNSVDTVILFELLEHIKDSQDRIAIMKEAKRVARKNVLITTPNSHHVEMLRRCGLTYEHMLEVDHKVFFTDDQIKSDVEAAFERSDIIPSEQIDNRLFEELFNLNQRKWLRRTFKFYPYTPKLFFRYYVVGDAS